MPSEESYEVRSLSRLAAHQDAAIAELNALGAIVVVTEDDRVVGVLERRPGHAASESRLGGGFSRTNRGQERSADQWRGWVLRWIPTMIICLAAVALLVPDSVARILGAIVGFAVFVVAGLDLVGWRPDRPVNR